jgi:hypothetical protein
MEHGFHKISVFFGSVLLMAAAGLLLLTAGSADGRRLSPIGSVQPAQRSNFAIFGTRPERLPQRYREAFAPEAHMRLNFALSQRTRLNGGGSLWTIPGRGWLCIATSLLPSASSGSTCTRTSTVLKRGLDLYILGGSRGAVTVGLVPNRVEAVRLRKGIRRVPVIRNSFRGRGQGLLKLIWHRFHDKVIRHPPGTVCPRVDYQPEPEAVC